MNAFHYTPRGSQPDNNPLQMNVVLKRCCLTTQAAGRSQTGGNPTLVSTGAGCFKMKGH